MRTLFWRMVHCAVAEPALWLTASAWAVTFYDWTAELAYGPDLRAVPGDGLRPCRGRFSTLDAIHAAGKAAERDGNAVLADVLGTVTLLWMAGSEAAAKAALDEVAEPFLTALGAPDPAEPPAYSRCRHGILTRYTDKLGPYAVATDCPECMRFVTEVDAVIRITFEIPGLGATTFEELAAEFARLRRERDQAVEANWPGTNARHRALVKAADLRGYTRALRAAENLIARDHGRRDASGIVAGMLRAAEVLAAGLLVVLLLAVGASAATLDDLPNPTITPGAVRVTEIEPMFPNCPTAYAVDAPMTPPANCPGPITEKEVCESRGTKGFRHSAGVTKRSVCAAYGVTDKAECSGVEDDHLISLELGGSDDRRNHFAEPWDGEWGAHKKDKLENLLRRLVCVEHALPIERAWRCIAEEWTKCYVLAQARRYSEMGQ